MNTVYDLIVIGSGVAGINSAVYAASEGLSVLVIEKSKIGGQIRGSAAVENLFGFPKISGRELISRAHEQALNFGAEFITGTVTDIVKHAVLGDEYDNLFSLKIENHLTNTRYVKAKAVILALGVQYRTLEANGIENHIGKHIHFGDSVIDQANRCKNKHVFVIGGANSAGQAAVYLSRYAAKVTMLVRSTLEKSMSKYLIDQINMLPNIEVLDNCVLEGVEGKQKLDKVTINRNGDRFEICDCSKLFVFVGASPNTAWLGDNIARDNHGYIIVDNRYMTSVDGIFAVGDIVSDSVKRVANAIGSSAVAVSNVHQYLAKESR